LEQNHVSNENLQETFYQNVLNILSDKGNWADFNKHYNLWLQVKKMEQLKRPSFVDGSIDVPEPDPDDYPLINP